MPKVKIFKYKDVLLSQEFNDNFEALENLIVDVCSDDNLPIIMNSLSFDSSKRKLEYRLKKVDVCPTPNS